MNTARVGGDRPLARRSLRDFFWAHPEWWALGVAGIAWAVMVVHGVQHWGHAHHASMTAAEELLHWLLMVTAMMVPLILVPLRKAAFRSLSERRHVAMLGFLVGYLAPWVVVGLLVLPLRAMAWTHTHAVAAATFGLAAAWAATPLRQRVLRSCHRTVPLAPSGWRAHRDCLRYGGVLGVVCVATCAPLMLACALTGHALPAMLGGMLIGCVERLAFRPPVRRVVFLTVALTAWYLLLALWP